jgi:hypothetical protein
MAFQKYCNSPEHGYLISSTVNNLFHPAGRERKVKIWYAPSAGPLILSNLYLQNPFFFLFSNFIAHESEYC